MNNSVEIYKSGGETQIEVRFEKETVWLSLNQIAELFGRDKSVVSRHLKKIYADGELEQLATVAKSATVQLEGKRKVEREIETYNLDAILSVGYRVNSKQGTQFRIWATQRLKEHLVQGFTINKQRLSQLKQSVKLIRSAAASEELDNTQSKEIIEVLTDFALGLDILDGYDNQSLQIKDTTLGADYKIDYDEAIAAIHQLRDKFGGSELFGKQMIALSKPEEKELMIKVIINSINKKNK